MNHTTRQHGHAWTSGGGSGSCTDLSRLLVCSTAFVNQQAEASANSEKLLWLHTSINMPADKAVQATSPLTQDSRLTLAIEGRGVALKPVLPYSHRAVVLKRRYLLDT